MEVLERLVSEASSGQLEYANSQLTNLPEEEQVWLPSEPMKNKEGPKALLTNPASLGSRLWEWKQGIDGIWKKSPMPARELAEELEAMSLESFLGQLH